MILAIDFDGVVHDFKNPVAGRRMGGPMIADSNGSSLFDRMGAVEAMQYLDNEGHELILHTVRGGSEQHIIDWCNYYHVPFHSITNVKPNADAYIDDKAIRFMSWGQTIRELEGL